MNDQQRQATAARQRKMVADQLATAPERPPPTPAPPQEPFNDLVERARMHVGERLDGPGIPVSYLRFIDKSFQLPGMQSGEQLSALTKPSGQAHIIELVRVGGTSCFLVWWLDPPRREVKHEFVERSAVKTWKLA
jgi:hypothetical protein